MEITKSDFERYERVRLSGRTNMFMIGNVEKLSGLTKEKIFFIMENYSDLKKSLGGRNG